VPQVATITVRAPGNCVVTIDKGSPQPTPFSAVVTIGTHVLVFRWANGLVRTEQVTVVGDAIINFGMPQAPQAR
jgi:hypothetical protein